MLGVAQQPRQPHGALSRNHVETESQKSHLPSSASGHPPGSVPLSWGQGGCGGEADPPPRLPRELSLWVWSSRGQRGLRGNSLEGNQVVEIKMNLLDVPLGFPFTELLQAGPRGCLVHNPGPSQGRRGLPGGRSGAESHLPTAGQPPALCGRGSLPGKSPCEMQSGLRANPWTFGSVCFTSVTET